MSIEARFRLQKDRFTLDVDLQLPDRGVTAIFGPSGCGKTTLLRLIAGLEQSPDGQLRIGDHWWQKDGQSLPTHRRPIGYVFQEASLFPHLSARANLEYGVRRVPKQQRKVSLEQAIELLQIGELLERMPDRLSGGERQRVAIARALAAGPQLLLMDEPLSALDLKRKREILPYLEQLHDQLQIPILYVTHAPDEVARLADHLVLLEQGRVLASGPLDQTLSRLDLPLRKDEDAGVVIKATVAEKDSRWHLARAQFDGGSLWVKDSGLPLDKPVRLRVLARDISLALEQHPDQSIQNLLPARIAEIVSNDHPAVALVRAEVGTTSLLARVTSRALDSLGLKVGSSVWLQIKSVAVLE
ncbi:molybdenum ABC transporter ATP-binding protein [Motiliproteus coralliicola]|uniref:Molybdenum ABC transporter ATP-binding protein n=1 Tax=Motiliproteus coralliicola TaxID=2283196 RepID=A0A369W8P0_9GAMM|nr:molybdenum ABC transporter ATP-binding protein [Motiliproteus coralliicola]RDE18272.1 molybdenum ABC transporter ATP-binding protein [Motiliproteus coralliicola]